MSVTRTRMHYRLWPALLLAAGGVGGAVAVLGVAPDGAGPDSCGSDERWVQVGPAQLPFDGPAAMIGNSAALGSPDDADGPTDGSARPVADYDSGATGTTGDDGPNLSACVDLEKLPSYPLPPSDPRS